MGGKWDGLRAKYPKVAVDAKWLEAIDAILDSEAPADVLGPEEADMKLRVRHLSDWQVKELYTRARLRQNYLAAQLSSVGTEVEAYQKLLTERMIEAGESNKKFDDGIQLIVSCSPYPTVTDRHKLVEWVKANGMEELLSLNYQTLASIVKERLEGKVQGALPDGVDVFVKDTLGCRGLKGLKQD